MEDRHSVMSSIRNPYRTKKWHFQTKRDEIVEKKLPETRPAAFSPFERAPPSASDLIVSASDKAGMDGIDRAEIDAIILKESGNSLYMQQQRRRDDKVNVRIEGLRTRLQAQDNCNDNKGWRQTMERQMNTELSEWIAARPSRSCKVVVDMDMFFMACELLTRPDITSTTPACVGGRNMICTSNYAARRYGVRAAMPGYIGEALVRQLSKGKEQLVFCKLNYPLYKEKSLLMRRALSEFDPHLTAYSLDDVYLDLGPYLLCSLLFPMWSHERIATKLASSSSTNSISKQELLLSDKKVDVIQCSDYRYSEKAPSISDVTIANYQNQLLDFSPGDCLVRLDQIVNDMRQRVFTATGGLTCSAGIAPNFLLAEIASDRIKPKGQLALASDHESITEFLYPLPIRKISGIGRVSEKVLKAFGIATVAQLYAERSLVRFLFDRGSSTSNFLLKASVGCSSSDGSVSEEDLTQQKGISRERTMKAGKPWEELLTKLGEIADLISDDMQKKKLKAQTVTVKAKLHTFDCLSRSKSLPQNKRVQSGTDVYATAAQLLSEIRNREAENVADRSSTQQLFSVRLLGIRCSNLHPDVVQRSGVDQMTIDRYLSENRSMAWAAPNPNDDTHGSKVDNEGSESYPDEVTTPSVSAFVEPKSLQERLCVELSPSHTTTPAVKNVRVECPICDKAFSGTVESKVNAKLNDHVDTCLSSSIVRKAIHEESTRAEGRSQSNKRSKGLHAFFVSSR